MKDRMGLTVNFVDIFGRTSRALEVKVGAR
jgi:hypothetical protein